MDPWVGFAPKLLLMPDRPSEEWALNTPPAVSKILRGRSLHFIQGSLINSDALSLFLESISNIFEIRWVASLETMSTSRYLPLIILPYNSFSDYPLNGKVPVKSAYSRIPRAHMSTCLPSYSCFLTSSGDM